MDGNEIRVGMLLKISDKTEGNLSSLLIGSHVRVLRCGNNREFEVKFSTGAIMFLHADDLEPIEEPSSDASGDDQCNSHPSKRDGEKRITFKVNEAEFYVGQHVWSIENDKILGIEVGTEFIVTGYVVFDGLRTLSIRRPEDPQNISALPKGLSFVPPRTHEWRRGDWARHKDGRKAFVCWAWRPSGELSPQLLMVSFIGEVISHFPASEFTFIGHTEAPE